jgi:Sec-independent protein secretion pathway component TatC
MLAVPMWLLYELGIIFARFIGKPAEAETQPDANALRPLDEAAMNAELDKAEAESAANRERP